MTAFVSANPTSTSEGKITKLVDKLEVHVDAIEETTATLLEALDPVVPGEQARIEELLRTMEEAKDLADGASRTLMATLAALKKGAPPTTGGGRAAGPRTGAPTPTRPQGKRDGLKPQELKPDDTPVTFRVWKDGFDSWYEDASQFLRRNSSMGHLWSSRATWCPMRG